MAKKACKCAEVECEECPEWIFTLADLIMCMMGLFVLLWVLKPPPGKAADTPGDEQWIKVLAAFRDHMEFLPDSQNPDPVDVYRLAKKLQDLKPLKGPGQGGPTKLPQKGAEGDEPEVMSVRPGQQAIVGGRVRFEAGEEALSAESQRILDEIAGIVKGHRNIFMVKGHTSLDDFPESASPQQKSGLSIRRAQVVADYLVSKGVEPEILRVQGCSTYEPVRERAYTPDSRRLNRRVEVESTTLLLADLQDKSETLKRAGSERPSTNPAPAALH
jgi:outer membrane protein OmpA-like peptidoglycan-associated protein